MKTFIYIIRSGQYKNAINYLVGEGLLPNSFENKLLKIYFIHSQKDYAWIKLFAFSIINVRIVSLHYSAY